MSEALEQRFGNFKKSIQINKYGSQWEKDRKNFLVNFKKGFFENLGAWDFFPVVYKNDFIEKDLQYVGATNEKKIIKIGNNNFCVPRNHRNRILSHSVNYLNIIKNYINENDVICEVGTGPGVLSALVHQEKKTTNILIDIPDVMLVGISFLFSIFPEKKYLLPNEIKDLDITNINKYDFIFLTPEQTELISENSVNFVINTQSFMEMDKNEVENYLKLFDRILKNYGHFFCSNRLRKRHYFFNYPFFLINNLKLISLEKDAFFYKNQRLASMLNLLAIKDPKGKGIKFGFFDKIKGIFLFKSWEFFYWTKIDIKYLINLFLKFVKIR